MNILEWVSQPWPWYVGGPMIAMVMFALIYFGNTFGVSSNFQTMCSIAGAGKRYSFFDFEWKEEIWNLVFIGGAVIGGWIASQFLMPDQAVQISEVTKTELNQMGISDPGQEFLPGEIFNWSGLFTLRGFIMIVVSGFLVGFGTRYAGGCTSGHAITGLSTLQIPYLIAVIGFFIGGLIVANLLMPLILSL